MRGLAALSVVVYHVTFSFNYPATALGQFVSERNAGPPVTAVVVFFLISGFVLYRPFCAARFRGEPMPDLVAYAVRRAARIVPAYWVALAIVTALLGLGYVVRPLGIVRYFGFLQLYGPWSVVNAGISPAWTLCVEVSFYALLPVLAWSVRRWATASRGPLAGELALCAAMVIASLAWQGVVFAVVPATSTWRLSWLLMLPGSLDLFAFGMLLAVLSVSAEAGDGLTAGVQRALGRAPWAWWLAGLAVLYAVGQMAGLTRHGLAAWWIPTHLLKALGSALLLVPLIFGDRREGWLRRILGSRPLRYLGAVSYGVYLWHFPLLDDLSPGLERHGELVTGLVLAAVTIAVASLSLFLVERPAQRLARRWLSERSERVAMLAPR